jgi:hypothetical protein
MEIKIGSDPELFVLDRQKQIVPVIGLLGGTKQVPLPIGDGFFVQEDNVLAEFNIPPASTESEFVELIWTGMQNVKARLPSGYDVLAKPSHIFDDSVLTHPKALEFGCDPDFNAWSGEQNDPPQPTIPTLRSGGGHLLVSYDNPTPTRNRHLIQLCDKYLGVPSILMDTDFMRRQLYGKAGAYRDKPWGVEYRTLSSFWLQSKTLTAWAYRNMLRAVAALEVGEKISVDAQERIIEAINQPNEALAAELVLEYNLEVV